MLDGHQLQQITWAIEAGIQEGLKQQPTLRDRFAMAALQGLVAGRDGWSDSLMSIYPERAYQMADSMLAAREPKTNAAEQGSTEKDPTNA
jgi:hypothetical protein